MGVPQDATELVRLARQLDSAVRQYHEEKEDEDGLPTPETELEMLELIGNLRKAVNDFFDAVVQNAPVVVTQRAAAKALQYRSVGAFHSRRTSRKEKAS